MSLEEHYARSSLSESRSLRIYPKRAFHYLFKMILGLSLMNVVTQITQALDWKLPLGDALAQLFDLDGEANIPAVFSALILLICAVLLNKIAQVHRLEQHRYALHWKALAIIFLFMSLDELMSLHEMLILPLRSQLNADGLLYFAWVVPGAIFVVICGLAFFSFLKALPAKTRWLFLLAGAVYVSGALGLELVGGYLKEMHTHHPSALTHGLYMIETTLEESLEMLGVSVFIYALLSYIASHLQGANWEFYVPQDDR